MKNLAKYFSMLLMVMTLSVTFMGCGKDDDEDEVRVKSLADEVVGTYSGRLLLNQKIKEDAYIVKIAKYTETTVQVQANFFSSSNKAENFNLNKSNGQITFVNNTYDNMNIIYINGILTINYLSQGGDMLTYSGVR